jgi:predicted dehydrogenase
MLADKTIDVVSVCTPNYLHASQTIESLSAGKHVLCEKPMAIKTGDCREMIACSEKAGKKIFVVKQNRYNPPVVAVKKAIDEGRLGKIFNIQLNCFWNRDASYYINSWKGTKEKDGGTLFTQFSHFIDLLIWMIGDIKNVSSILRNYNHTDIIEFEDTGIVQFQFLNGAIGGMNYTVNSFQKNMEGSLTIFGEKGTVKIGGQYLNELEYQNIRDYKIENLPKGNPANQYGNYTGSMSNHGLVYDNVINVLEHNESMNVSAADAMKTVEVITKIYQSEYAG